MAVFSTLRNVAGVKRLSAEAELRWVTERGGQGINEPLVLGNNVFNTEKMIVQPMRPGEKLVQVKGGDHRSYFSAFTDSAKELAIRAGPNDVGDHQPAYFSDGTRRPAVHDDLLLATYKMFIDNFIFASEFNDQGPILLFLKLLCGLTKEGNPPKTKRISIGPATLFKDEQQWKVACADVSLDDIAFILQVYYFATKKWDGDEESLLKWAKKRCWDHMERLGTKFGALCDAASLAHRKAFCIVDIDGTVDVPGTLDAQPFADAAERAGHKVRKDTMCGLQCVKYTPAEYITKVPANSDVPGNPDVPRNTEVTMKLYDKVTETMQSGKARSPNIACKFALLASPTTDRLNAIVIDPKYNKNGITRLEVTCPFNIGVTWTIEKMAKMIDSARELVADFLVVSSIQDHIAGMEPFIEGSTFTFYPQVFDRITRNFHRKGKKNKKGKNTDCNLLPVGSVSHWMNSYTHKMNGMEVHAKIGTRDSHVDGWTPTALAIAACSNAGYDVTGFICVGGFERMVGEEDPLQHRYYRMIVVERHAIAPKVQVDTGFIGTIKNTLQDIGVNPDELILNPTIIQVLKAKEVNIEICFSSAELQPINECCSEAVDRFVRLPKRIKKPVYENMPTEESRWTDIRWGSNRGKKQLKFRFEGDWYWLPPKWQENVLEYVFDKTDFECIFCWGTSSLVCEFRPVTKTTTSTTDDANMDFTPANATAHPAIETTSPIQVGNISCIDSIPIVDEGLEITSGGFVMRRGKKPSCFLSFRGMIERFWVPTSIADSLLFEAKTRSTQINLDNTSYNLECIAGWRLIRGRDDCKIGVTGVPNPEHRMYIVNASGDVQVQQREAKPSLQKRQAVDSLDDGVSSKRPRIH
jgi:hypothetical protein